MPVLSTAIERGGRELKVAPAVARLVWIDQLRLEKATGVEFKEPLPLGLACSWIDGTRLGNRLPNIVALAQHDWVHVCMIGVGNEAPAAHRQVGLRVVLPVLAKAVVDRAVFRPCAVIMRLPSPLP